MEPGDVQRAPKEGRSTVPTGQPSVKYAPLPASVRRPCGDLLPPRVCPATVPKSAPCLADALMSMCPVGLCVWSDAKYCFGFHLSPENNKQTRASSDARCLEQHCCSSPEVRQPSVDEETNEMVLASIVFFLLKNGGKLVPW